MTWVARRVKIGTVQTQLELAETLRREMVARAENAGSRALSWDISQFDKIGGKGTITSVWNMLKSDERVSGQKRPHSSTNEEEESDMKKLKMSLNISDT